MAHLTRFAPAWLLVPASLLVGSCGGDAKTQEADGPTGKEGTVAVSSSLLTLASSCEDATAALKEQLKSQVAQAFAQGDTCAYAVGAGTDGSVRDGAQMAPTANAAGGSASVSVGGTTTGMATGTSTGTSTGTTTGTSTGTSTGDGTGTSTGSWSEDANDGTPSVPQDASGDGAKSYSTTNTQVAGVDEPDIVKTDGKNLYVSHSAQLDLVRAWPVEDLAVVTSVGIEGTPREMFVVGDAYSKSRKIVVISDVNGPELYQAAGVTPPVVANNAYVTPMYEDGWGVGGAASMKDVGVATGAAAPVADDTESPVAPAVSGLTTSPPTSQLPVTKVTVLTGTDDELKVSSEVYYDGQYVSARRQEALVHLVLQLPRGFPSIDLCPTSAEQNKANIVVATELMEKDADVAAMPAEDLNVLVQEELADIVISRNAGALDALSIEDFRPRRFVRDGDTADSTQVDCKAMYLPAAGSMGWGVTYVAELDITQPEQDAGSHALLGRTDTVYENSEALVLASSSTAYDEAERTWKQMTVVHRFDLDQGHAKYTASAEQVGVLGGTQAQFAIDVKGDDLRLVLSDTTVWRGEKNRLAVLRPGDEEGLLEVVGEVTNIGDGEQVKSVRYVGDRVYVVTFMNTDPLFVLDASNGEKPKKLSQTPEIPGFSTYMHPLDESHLLTIGEENSQTLLQIFDVNDGTKAPEQVAKYLADGYGSSSAEYEYKAFTFFAEKKLLAIPYVSYSSAEMQNQMLVFRVDVADGIEPLGAVDGSFMVATPPTQNETTYCYANGDMSSMFQRGVFMEDVLFAVASQGISAVDAAAPENELGTLLLGGRSNPWYCYDNMTGMEVRAGSGGAVGVTTSTGGTPTVDDVISATGGTAGAVTAGSGGDSGGSVGTGAGGAASVSTASGD